MYFRKSYTANRWKNRIDHTSDIMKLHDMLGKKNAYRWPYQCLIIEKLSERAFTYLRTGTNLSNKKWAQGHVSVPVMHKGIVFPSAMYMKCNMKKSSWDCPCSIHVAGLQKRHAVYKKHNIKYRKKWSKRSTRQNTSIYKLRYEIQWGTTCLGVKEKGQAKN